MTHNRKSWLGKGLAAGAATVLTLGAGLGVAHAGYDADGAMMAGNSMDSNGMAMDTKAANREMLIKTLSEEMTEIQHLAAQQTTMRKMDTKTTNAVARMYGNWIRMHKAGVPMLVKLIRQNDGDPTEAKILKPAVLSNDAMKMMHATAMEHQAAVMSSQMRFTMTNSSAIKKAMHKRANVARMHLRELSRYHNPENCPMCAKMMM